MSVTLLPRVDGPLARRHRPATRIDDAAAALINRLARPREAFETIVESLKLRLAPADLRLDAVPALPDAIAIGFLLDDGSRLGLTLPAAMLDRLLRAVQDDLAPPPSPSVGALLAELALAPLLDAAESATGRRVEVENIGPPAPRLGGMTLLIDGTLGEDFFPAQLDLGPAPDARLAAIVALIEALPPRSASISALPVPVAFVVGRTALSLRQLRSLRIGDAVLPDLWPAQRGEVWVVLGDGHIATATTDRHKSTLKTPFRPAANAVATASGGAGMAQDTSAETRAPQGTDEAGLDAVGVTLAFELGRRTLGIGELKSIGAGHVFDLGLDPAQAVDLVANGARIGRGEIVEIGERIGVRVVRLFGQD